MAAWTPAIHAAVRPHVALVDDRLHREFVDYVDPGRLVHAVTARVDDGSRDEGCRSATEAEFVSVEFVVDDLERAEEFLVGLMGLEILQRSRHAEFDADLVLLRSGSVTLSLLHPTDIGDRPPFPAVEPKLAHLTFVVEDEDEFVAMRSRLVAAGAAVAHNGPRMFHLPEGFMQSVLGAAPAFAVVQVGEPGEDDRS